MTKSVIKTTLAIALSASSLNAFSSVLDNTDIVHKGPGFSAKMNIGALKVNGRDIAPWAFSVTAGTGGIFIVNDGLKIKYDLTADFSNAINDNDDLTWTQGNVNGGINDDVYVRDAKITVITDYGIVLLAPRTGSGQWEQVYGEVDTFEYNRFHSQTGDIAMFGQPEQTTDLFVYATPRIEGFQFGTSVVTTNEQNGVDRDIWTNRLTYKYQDLYIAGSHTIMKAGSLPTNEDYTRSALSASYDFGIVKLAGVYEVDTDHPTGDWDSYAANAEFRINPNWTLKTAYAEKDHDIDSFDRSGFVLGVDRHFGENIKFFIETGQYDDAPDNIALGVGVKL
ncbi:hypothetical protein C7H09_12525 [Marinobacter fuscus]|uniref:Porin domain-containing protein n=1 Tax=Marinobacter fuscus TaxID=2109942 RepID=A0A2T1K818_9GAMM|nr:porin [Marinobacter fuscus]PSF05893.1 hypothetical protein C7H09_12525 [Marinobacter fuscus]